MKSPLLLLDVNYLAHRAYYAFPDLEYKGTATGVAFGVFRDIIKLQNTFCTDRVVFCFDYGQSKRAEICPEYKANRHHHSIKATREQQEVSQKVQFQIDMLRDEYLPYVGFKNVLFEEGYEADDIIASLAIDKAGKKIIVSADKDLYQLLKDGIIIYDPRKGRAFTEKTLLDNYGVTPKQWVMVKAIAGCKTDNIAGVKGVGEITAAKYILKQLSEGCAAYRNIQIDGKFWRKNMEIVRLPYKGTPHFNIIPNKFSKLKWHKLVKKLGMTSIRGSADG